MRLTCANFKLAVAGMCARTAWLRADGATEAYVPEWLTADIVCPHKQLVPDQMLRQQVPSKVRGD